jgi:hypothetical protein
MSYCVNCGVELAKTEKRCPLCLVEVINPAETAQGEVPRVFPRQRDSAEAFDRDLWIKLVSVVLVLPAVICFVSNMLVRPDVFWSLYVAGALAVGWTFCVSPFISRRYFPLLWIVANTLASAGYLYLVEVLSHGNGWFLPLALPITLGVAVLSLVITVLMKNGVLRKLYAAAALFLAVGLLTVLVDLCTRLYATGIFVMGWSWFSLISCLTMAGTLVLIEHKMRVKEKLKRKLHF